MVLRQSSAVPIYPEGTNGEPRATRDGIAFSADILFAWALAGRVFIAGDADQNDTVTGQTSFANTTPTFMIDVPEGVVCIPLYTDLSQTGTVAGGDIELLVEYDRVVRYASGGTAERIRSTHTRQPIAPRCVLYSGATAAAGYGMRVFSADIAPDVSPAEGILPGPLWTPVVPLILVGPAAFLVYSSAGTTGPTWLWSVCWAELPSDYAV